MMDRARRRLVPLAGLLALLGWMVSATAPAAGQLAPPSNKKPSPTAVMGLGLGEQEEESDESGQAPLRITGPLRTVEDVAYSEGRTTVEFGDLKISSDRLVIDLLTQEIQAEGNVLIEGKTEQITASSVRYSARFQQGVAFDSVGRFERIFFFAGPKETADTPSFRRINEDAAIFKGARLTSCGFPVPHYYITTTEIVVILGKRVFLKNPVVHVRGIPIFWLPYYSRAFDEDSRWQVELGLLDDDDYGPYARIMYEVFHKSTTADWLDPAKARTRHKGRLGLKADVFTGGALGVGIDYQYSFDFQRHIGSLSVYGMRDTVRQIDDPNSNGNNNTDNLIGDGEGEDSENRWLYRHRHNSLFGDFIAQWNADWMSDPDIYYDVIDPLTEESEGPDRGRVAERQIRAAVTYLKEDWLARINTETKDRITRDYYQDFSEPLDDDLNYAFDTDITQDNDNNSNGISSDRYGRVAEKYEGRVATRLVPVFRSPLYWRTEMNLFDNLDSGFNEFDSADDERFTGADIYGALTHRTKLTSDGRFTWLNTVGAGVGFYDRGSDSLLGDQVDFPSAAELEARRAEQELLAAESGVDIPARDVEVLPGTRVNGAQFPLVPTANPDGTITYPDGSILNPVDGTVTPPPIGLRALDDETIYLGSGRDTASYRDVDPTYLWADYTSRLSARFTEDLSGYIRYTYRKGSDEGPGNFFERIGRQEAFEDIYDFPTDYHWVETDLTYTPFFPNLQTFLRTGYNLESGQDLNPNERLFYATVGNNWSNETNEWTVGSYLTYEGRRARSSNDPDQYDDLRLFGGVNVAWTPKHERYYASLDINGDYPLEDDPKFNDPRSQVRFDEEDPDINITPIFGRKLGPKYVGELYTTYNTDSEAIEEASVKITRDLHDAEISLTLGVRNEGEEDEDNFDDTNEDDPQEDYKPFARAQFRLKLPTEEQELSASSVGRLNRRDRTSASYVE